MQSGGARTTVRVPVCPHAFGLPVDCLLRLVIRSSDRSEGRSTYTTRPPFGTDWDGLPFRGTAEWGGPDWGSVWGGSPDWQSQMAVVSGIESRHDPGFDITLRGLVGDSTVIEVTQVLHTT